MMNSDFHVSCLQRATVSANSCQSPTNCIDAYRGRQTAKCYRCPINLTCELCTQVGNPLAARGKLIHVVAPLC